jgi:hypothetical protein
LRERETERERQRQTDRQADSFIKEKVILPLESCLLEGIDLDILFLQLICFLESITRKERTKLRLANKHTDKNTNLKCQFTD